MIKNIIILIIFVFIVLLLNYYNQKSSLSFKNNLISIEVEGSKVQFQNYGRVKRISQHFSNVQIEQIEIRVEKNSICFETARVEPLYEFTYNTKKIVRILFDTKEIKEVFSVNGLHAMQIVLNNGEILNLLVDDNDNKELIFLYGLNNKKFNALTQKLAKSPAVELEATSCMKFMSQWSVKHNDIDGMIGSIDY